MQELVQRMINATDLKSGHRISVWVVGDVIKTKTKVSVGLRNCLTGAKQVKQYHIADKVLITMLGA